MTHEDYLRMAVEIATEGVDGDKGGPFGAVVVKNGEVIAKACNTVTSTCDPVAHAEVNAIRMACNRIGHYELKECVLYTSCEPCPMCLGAIYWARIPEVYYAAQKSDASNYGFDDSKIYEEIAKEPAGRKVVMKRIAVEGLNSPFESWDRKENKKLY